MSRTVEAEYIAEGNVLRLAEPLPGVRDHEKLRITIDGSGAAERGEPSILREDDTVSERLARAANQRRYLQQLTSRVDLSILSSEEMWR